MTGDSECCLCVRLPLLRTSRDLHAESVPWEWEVVPSAQDAFAPCLVAQAGTQQCGWK